MFEDILPSSHIYDNMPMDFGVKHTTKSVLVIGNGFDLDLKLKTKYSDYAASEYWPFKENNYDSNTLQYFLNINKEKVDTWFDLEELLAVYASTKNENNSHYKDNDIKALDNLTQGLCDYLKEEENKLSLPHGIPQGVPSAKIILDIFAKKIKNKENCSIYTFNYTNLYSFAHKMMIDIDQDLIDYIHGSVKENNMVLGTGDQREFNDNYFAFRKSARMSYKSTNLVEDLLTADEVYIFGHSLGTNDHDYFREFFMQSIKTRKMPFAPNKVKIRIFTLNNKSELETKRHLMRLTDNHLTGLFAHCDFKIYHTDDLNWIKSEEPEK